MVTVIVFSVIVVLLWYAWGSTLAKLERWKKNQRRRSARNIRMRREVCDLCSVLYVLGCDPEQVVDLKITIRQLLAKPDSRRLQIVLRKQVEAIRFCPKCTAEQSGEIRE